MLNKALLSLVFHIVSKFIITRINPDGVLNHCQIVLISGLKMCSWSWNINVVIMTRILLSEMICGPKILLCQLNVACLWKCLFNWQC